MKIKCFEVICLMWQQKKVFKNLFYSVLIAVVLNCFNFLCCLVCYLAGKLVFALIFRTKWIVLPVIMCMMFLHQSIIGSNSTSEDFQPPLVNLDAVDVSTYFILTSFVMA